MRGTKRLLALAVLSLVLNGAALAQEPAPAEPPASEPAPVKPKPRPKPKPKPAPKAESPSEPKTETTAKEAGRETPKAPQAEPALAPDAAPKETAPAASPLLGAFAAPPVACDPGKSVLYDGPKDVALWVTRTGTVTIDNPLRPLTPDVTRVLQIVIGGKLATVYGPDLGAVRRGASPAALEGALGGPIRWDKALGTLPDTLNIVADSGATIAEMRFKECGDAPAAKALPVAKARKDGQAKQARKAPAEPGAPAPNPPAGGAPGAGAVPPTSPTPPTAATAPPRRQTLPQGAIPE